jgi:hypothetical protein
LVGCPGIQWGSPSRPPKTAPNASERPAGDGHLLQQAAHLAGVLLVVQRVDDRAGPEEEAGLEEGVREHVEEARRVNAPTPTPMNMKPSWLTVE